MEKFKFSNRGNALVGQEMFKVLDKAKALENKGKKIIHLELGQPRFEPPVGLISRTIQSLNEKEVGYSSSYGIQSLREKLKLRFNKLLSDINIENIIISTANLLISQSLHLLTNPRDKVIVFSPTFPSYIAAANFLEIDLIELPLAFHNNFQLTNDDIDKAISYKPKVIIINSANNPTGAVYTKNILKYLKKKSLENGIWLISDETYSDISYNKDFFSFTNETLENIIVISSFSKIYSIPGYRLGFAISEPHVIEKLSLSNSSLVSCHSIFSQKGVEEIILDDKKYITNINNKLRQLSILVENILKSSTTLKNQFVRPDSGYYIFINIGKSKLKSLEFCNKMLSEQLVACTPGISFGKDFDNYIRISICGNQEDLLEGVKKIVSFFDTAK